jgi:predicted Zn-ribbon and HTH transcriptional regulator
LTIIITTIKGKTMTLETIEIIKEEEEMARGRAILPTLTCKRCGHKWIPRISSPAVCPNCHSPYWDKPIQTKKRRKK